MPHHQHRNANAAPPQPRVRRTTGRTCEWIEGTLVELNADAEHLVLRVQRSSRPGTREGDELAVRTAAAKIKAGDGDGDGRAGMTDLFPGDALHILLDPTGPGDPPKATRVTQLNPPAPPAACGDSGRSSDSRRHDPAPDPAHGHRARQGQHNGTRKQVTPQEPAERRMTLMTSWATLKSHIHENFTVARSENSRIQLEFGVGNGRTQVVFLTCHTTSTNDEWLVIESPIGRLGETDITAALTACDGILCGGLGTNQGTFITIRHAIPLTNLDLNEFTQPLALITMAADQAEAALSTKDAY